MSTIEQPQTTRTHGSVSRATKTGTDAHVYFLLYGQKPKKGHSVTFLRKRFPISSVNRVYKRLKVKKSTVLALMGMSEETYRQRSETDEALSSTESDRLYRLARIEAQAADVFEDEELAADWLKTPNRALNAKPIDLLDTEVGADQVERVLTRIEHGVYS